jgi:hypothetical protein
MVKVFAQIVVSLELEELSVSGTQLDLMGLSSKIKETLEALPMCGPDKQMQVTDVSSPTKAWEINAQLAYSGDPDVYLRPRPISPARSKFVVEDVVVTTEIDAYAIKDQFKQHLAIYGNVSVADLYDWLGVTGQYGDIKWGWTDSESLSVQPCDAGFLVKLPPIKFLEKA